MTRECTSSRVRPCRVIRVTVVRGSPRSARAASSSSESTRGPSHSRRYSASWSGRGREVAITVHQGHYATSLLALCTEKAVKRSKFMHLKQISQNPSDYENVPLATIYEDQESLFGGRGKSLGSC